MKKYISGIILTLLIIFSSIFISDTKALDGDYKNNLLKVDVSKNIDGSYKIDLFTQKPYSEPVRVIKKSDTNYYVFLPETYHSITSVGTTGDVNKVDVKLYPYAGQDLNNGYTKIDIQTSKPVTFLANVKTVSNQVPKIDPKKLAQLDSAFDNKPSYTQPKKVENAADLEKAVSKTQPAKNIKEQQPLKTAAAPQKEQPESLKLQAPNRIANASNNEIEIVTKPSTNPAPDRAKQETKLKDKQIPINLEEVIDPDYGKEDKKLEQEAQEQGLTELATGESQEIPEITKEDETKQTIKTVLNFVRENFLLLLAIVLLIIALILLGLPKTKKASKEQKEDTMLTREGLSALNQTAVNKDNKEISDKDAITENNEGYNVYEAGHIEPVSIANEVHEFGHTADLTGEIAHTAVIDKPDDYEIEPMQTYISEEPVSSNDEADVLASESFGEGRGLCLVNYDGNIALVGYINEEIFVIQNFGKITLINPNIQVRIAEQNDDSTIYIVKAANSKLMVKETKTFMGLEMVM